MSNFAGACRGAAAVSLTVLAALAVVALAGCGGQADEAGQGGAGGRSGGPPPDGRYELQGIVERLPQGPDNSLYIRHEAIDDFRDAHGEIVGMDSMTMPFPVAEGVPLEGVEAGDPIAFTFEVRWNDQPRFQVTSLRELPAGTEIEFRRAVPPEE